MKNLFSFFTFLTITMVLSTLVNAQDEVVIDTLRTQWEQYIDNPVVKPDARSRWDAGMAFSPTVIMFKDTLRMWYMGSLTAGFGGIIYIGYAWSLDGITWQQYSKNPILKPRQGQWDYPHLSNPRVMADGDTLRMWYGGGNMIKAGMRIGYAVSVDGIHWNRYPTLVIKPKADWNKDGVLPGAVIKEDGIYKMWFSGGLGTAGYPTDSTHWSIGYATSSDCIHWILNEDPVLIHGSSTDFDENLAFSACVIRSDVGYDMWYGGHSETAQKDPNKPYATIGYASSPDGITWTKYNKNPVVSPSSISPQWAKGYYTPSVISDGNQFRMWFGGWDGGSGLIAIGYATSVLDTSNYSGMEDNLLVRVPKDYKLFQNYPNPFNPSTTISYNIPKEGYVTLKVYSVAGKEVATISDGEQNQGRHNITFDGSNLASGIYFYRLQAGNYAESKKMILLK